MALGISSALAGCTRRLGGDEKYVLGAGDGATGTPASGGDATIGSSMINPKLLSLFATVVRGLAAAKDRGSSSSRSNG